MLYSFVVTHFRAQLAVQKRLLRKGDPRSPNRHIVATPFDIPMRGPTAISGWDDGGESENTGSSSERPSIAIVMPSA